MNRIARLPALLLLIFYPPVLMHSCGGAERIAGTDTGGVLIVVNKMGDDIHFIDRRDGTLLNSLPTGNEPHEVEVSDDGRIAVISNYGSRANPGNTLSVYDVPKAELIRTIDLGEHTRPHGMQWIRGTSRVLVTAEGSQHLLVVDTATGETIMALHTGEPVSHMVAATPDFSRAFVPSIVTGNVVVFDLETGELIERIFSGAGAEGISMHPLGEEVWVTNRDENTISVIDTRSLKVVETIPCEDFPIRAKFTPGGGYLLVSNARSGDVAVFDSRTREKVAGIKLTPPVPAGRDEAGYFAEFEGTSVPVGLVVPDNRRAYVSNTRSDAISIIDLERMEISGYFTAGREPDGINYSPLMPVADGNFKP
jgi:YVTN family beta-propeller protein